MKRRGSVDGNALPAILGIGVLVVILLVSLWVAAHTPSRGTITRLEIVAAHTDWHLDPVYGGKGTQWVSRTEHVPASYRVHILGENGWSNYFDVPEGVYRGLKVGEHFDSKNMHLADK